VLLPALAAHRGGVAIAAQVAELVVALSALPGFAAGAGAQADVALRGVQIDVVRGGEPGAIGGDVVAVAGEVDAVLSERGAGFVDDVPGLVPSFCPGVVRRQADAAVVDAAMQVTVQVTAADRGENIAGLMAAAVAGLRLCVGAGQQVDVALGRKRGCAAGIQGAADDVQVAAGGTQGQLACWAYAAAALAGAFHFV